MHWLRNEGTARPTTRAKNTHLSEPTATRDVASDGSDNAVFRLVPLDAKAIRWQREVGRSWTMQEYGFCDEIVRLCRIQGKVRRVLEQS